MTTPRFRQHVLRCIAAQDRDYAAEAERARSREYQRRKREAARKAKPRVLRVGPRAWTCYGVDIVRWSDCVRAYLPGETVEAGTVWACASEVVGC